MRLVKDLNPPSVPLGLSANSAKPHGRFVASRKCHECGKKIGYNVLYLDVGDGHANVYVHRSCEAERQEGLTNGSV